MKFKWTNTLLFVIILFNSGVFILYGSAKILGIQGMTKFPFPDTLAKDLSPVSVMWYFHFIKKEYSFLIGLAQIIPAILIIFRRTRLFGAILYFCAVVNILAINIIFEITNWTLLLSIVLTINILVIIISERKKVVGLLS